MVRIRRFGVVRTATVVAVLYMVIAAIFAIPFALLAAAAGSSVGSVGDVNLAGILTIVLLAVVGYGVLGWVFTAIACLLYNLVAGWTGGIEVQVERVDAPPPAPVWGSAPPPTTPPGPPAPPAAPSA